MGFFDVMIAIIIIVHRAGSTCGISCSVLSEHDMTAIDPDGGDHTIEVDRETCHAALSDRCIQSLVDLLQFFFQCADVHVICVVIFKDLEDLALDVRVGRTAQGDPDRVVAVFNGQGAEILEKLRELAVVIIADVEIREDLDKARTDLTEAGFLALSVVVLDHLDDRGFDDLRRGKEVLIILSVLVAAIAVGAVGEETVISVRVGNSRECRYGLDRRRRVRNPSAPSAGISTAGTSARTADWESGEAVSAPSRRSGAGGITGGSGILFTGCTLSAS